MANTHTTLTDLFTDVADAIREVDGSTGTIVADTFPDKIRNLSSGSGSLEIATYTLTDINTKTIKLSKPAKVLIGHFENTYASVAMLWIVGKYSGSTWNPNGGEGNITAPGDMSSILFNLTENTGNVISFRSLNTNDTNIINISNDKLTLTFNTQNTTAGFNSSFNFGTKEDRTKLVVLY